MGYNAVLRSNTISTPILRRLVPLLLLLLSCAFLYRAPYSASALEVVPDSVEYAVGAQRIVTLGRYDLDINHVTYPPRYPPWFSRFVLAPAYRLFPGDIGNTILPVLIFALVGVGAVYVLGARFGGVWGGAGSVVCLLAFKEYHTLARNVMSDVPTAALGLWGCWFYLDIQAPTRSDVPTQTRARQYLLAGVIAGMAAALRYEGLIVLLPFLPLAWKQGSRRGAYLLLLALPSLLVILANGAYNAQTFGSWRRNGYDFWCSVPYDYPSLVWGARFIPGNLIALAAKQSLLIFALGAFGIWRLHRLQHPLLSPVLRFLAWTALPLGVLHLFYFVPGVRFYLLGMCVLCVLGGVGLVSALPARVTERDWTLPVCFGVAVALFPLWLRAFALPAPRRVVEDTLARVTPPNAIIVTGLDPVYLEPLVLRGTNRSVVPLTRDVEYAGKLIAPQRVAHPAPPPRSLRDARGIGMKRGGARDVIAYTADEAPDRLRLLSQAGIPVYIDLTFAPPDFALRSCFSPEEIADVPDFPWLKRLMVRGTGGGEQGTGKPQSRKMGDTKIGNTP